MQSIDDAATELLGREAALRDGGRLTEQWRELDLETAYRIQDETLRRRLDRGEQLIGVKLGMTSVVKQRRMGIDTPLVAWLTDRMRQPADGLVEISRFIHPRVEPEIVFIMADRLAGPGVTAEQALAAVGAVHAGAEIVDSRFADFSFALADAIADNASAAAFVIADKGVAPADIDLVNETVLVEQDGVAVDSATGEAVMGHPAQALALAANELHRRGLAIEAGQIVLTGGITDAVTMKPGSMVSFTFGTLGTIMVPSET